MIFLNHGGEQERISYLLYPGELQMLSEIVVLLWFNSVPSFVPDLIGLSLCCGHQEEPNTEQVDSQHTPTEYRPKGYLEFGLQCFN